MQIVDHFDISWRSSGDADPADRFGMEI